MAEDYDDYSDIKYAVFKAPFNWPRGVMDYANFLEINLKWKPRLDSIHIEQNSCRKRFTELMNSLLDNADSNKEFPVVVTISQYELAHFYHGNISDSERKKISPFVRLNVKRGAK